MGQKHGIFISIYAIIQVTYRVKYGFKRIKEECVVLDIPTKLKILDRLENGEKAVYK